MLFRILIAIALPRILAAMQKGGPGPGGFSALIPTPPAPPDELPPDDPYPIREAEGNGAVGQYGRQRP